MGWKKDVNKYILYLLFLSFELIIIFYELHFEKKQNNCMYYVCITSVIIYKRYISHFEDTFLNWLLVSYLGKLLPAWVKKET